MGIVDFIYVDWFMVFKSRVKNTFKNKKRAFLEALAL